MSAEPVAPVLDLPELERLAAGYQWRDGELPILFSAEPYTRTVLHWDDTIEVVLICFAAGQTSSVHHHRGSNCVIRVVSFKVMETHFAAGPESTLEYHRPHSLEPGTFRGSTVNRSIS
jgi:predicted metal-dependent enzyme (double-stranded beta helix superfamily)